MIERDAPTGGASMSEEPDQEDLRELVASLRAEIARLREELRQVRRDHHEVPPHNLSPPHTPPRVRRGHHGGGRGDQQGACQCTVFDRSDDRRGGERRRLE